MVVQLGESSQPEVNFDQGFDLDFDFDPCEGYEYEMIIWKDCCVGIEELRGVDFYNEDSANTTRHRGELLSSRGGSKAPRPNHKY